VIGTSVVSTEVKCWSAVTVCLADCVGMLVVSSVVVDVTVRSSVAVNVTVGIFGIVGSTAGSFEAVDLIVVVGVAVGAREVKNDELKGFLNGREKILVVNQIVFLGGFTNEERTEEIAWPWFFKVNAILWSGPIVAGRVRVTSVPPAGKFGCVV